MTSKVRPYRIDYFKHSEIQGAKVRLHSLIVNACTANDARKFIDDSGCTVIKAYRYYQKLGRERKAYVLLESLVSKKRAAQIIENIQRLQEEKDPAPPESAEPIPAAIVTPPPVAPAPVTEEVYDPLRITGPESPATKAVMEDYNNMMSHDTHEQMMDNFVLNADEPPVYPNPTTGANVAMAELVVEPPQKPIFSFYLLQKYFIWIGFAFIGLLLLYMIIVSH